ncbi:MAG: LacI family DNA-binding transcriptional regulator [Geminicoccaceae bacterium]
MRRTVEDGPTDERQESTVRARANVTLRDVADAAGVSPMSVSNFINARLGQMRPETRARIQAEIERLGYRPHAAARNLRLSRRLAIDMVIIDEAPHYLSDPFTTEVVAGLSNRLNSQGYALQLQGLPAEVFNSSPMVRAVRTDAICLLLSGPEETRRRIVKSLLDLGQPLVLFQDTISPPDPDLCIIRQADREGGRLLAKEVLGRGARRLLMLVPATVWPAIEERVAGVKEVVGEAAERPDLRIVPCGNADFRDTQAALVEEIDRHGVPDAILAGNDQMGIAAMKLMAARGLAVPGDVAITGFNAFEFWQYTEPMLTTVRSAAYRMGALGGEVLLKRLTAGQFEQREIVLPVSLQRGGST